MSRIARLAALAAVVGGLGTLLSRGVSVAQPEPEPAVAPVATVKHPGGSLVICGGWTTPDDVRDRFVELAGGREARIVVIPTARRSADSGEFGEFLVDWARYKLSSIDLIHARSRAEANQPDFVRPIAQATGVWFCGGFQQRLTAAYLDTAVEQQLHALLARGGVIGGTSAGAAIMTRVMIDGGRDQARLAQGFDFLREAVVDQHFLRRNRMKRLVGTVQAHPDLLGLGIDEQTALVVDVQARRAQVIGRSYVVACIPQAPATPGAAEPPPTHIEILKPGDEADLVALKTQASNAIASNLRLDAR